MHRRATRRRQPFPDLPFASLLACVIVIGSSKHYPVHHMAEVEGYNNAGLLCRTVYKLWTHCQLY
jgi:hypothetical protein